MKKRSIIYFIGIGLLVLIPFVRVSVAAPPCWVGAYEDEIYIWEYNNNSVAAAGDYTTDDVATGIYVIMGQWAGFGEDMAGYGLMPGSMSHEITTVGDLGPDLEYGSNYQSAQIIHELNWTVTGLYSFPWDDKVTLTNVYNALVIEDSTEFVLWHDNLTMFFDAYSWQLTSVWASTKMDWTEAVTAANLGLAAFNATATVVTNGTDEVGFKITVAAGNWIAPYANTKDIGLEVTYADGLLNTWDLTYGTDTIMDVELVQGSTQFKACSGADAIPGFELPIIIGIASVISLVLIKKIKKK